MFRSAAIAMILVSGLAGCTSGGDVSDAPGPTTSAPPFFPSTPDRAQPAAPTRVRVFFVDAAADPPQLVSVEREVPTTDVVRNSAIMLFAGPTVEEARRGLQLVTSGASGVADVTLVDAVATVRLVGGCEQSPGPFSVADLLIRTLKSVGRVQAVKVLAPDGSTRSPRGPDDSMPQCLVQ